MNGRAGWVQPASAVGKFYDTAYMMLGYSKIALLYLLINDIVNFASGSLSIHSLFTSGIVVSSSGKWLLRYLHLKIWRKYTKSWLRHR